MWAPFVWLIVPPVSAMVPVLDVVTCCVPVPPKYRVPGTVNVLLSARLPVMFKVLLSLSVPSRYKLTTVTLLDTVTAPEAPMYTLSLVVGKAPVLQLLVEAFQAAVPPVQKTVVPVGRLLSCNV